jgi:hypothetical protein
MKRSVRFLSVYIETLIYSDNNPAKAKWGLSETHLRPAQVASFESLQAVKVSWAQLGSGPYKSSDVAAQLGEPVQKLGPRRAAIIRKGMIYSPAHGDIAFTVPMFDTFLRRTMWGFPNNEEA